jgi:hypothetical protein
MNSPFHTRTAASSSKQQHCKQHQQAGSTATVQLPRWQRLNLVAVLKPHGSFSTTWQCPLHRRRLLLLLVQAKLEAKEREHFKKKGISFEGEQACCAVVLVFAM